MRYLYIAIAVILIISQGVHGTLISALRALNLSSGTQIGPASNYTQRWSSYDAPSYVVAIKPVTDGDVAKIVCALF